MIRIFSPPIFKPPDALGKYIVFLARLVSVSVQTELWVMYLALVFAEVGLLSLFGDASIIEADLMVACNYDLMLELQSVQEGEELGEVLLPAVVGEVPAVDEDVSSHRFDQG